MAPKAPSGRSSFAPVAAPPSREREVLLHLFGAAKIAAVAGTIDLSRVEVRLQGIVNGMPSTRRDVFVSRFDLVNERSDGPCEHVKTLADELGLSVRAVEQHLAAGEDALRGTLRREFPALMADPRPTPQTH